MAMRGEKEVQDAGRIKINTRFAEVGGRRLASVPGPNNSILDFWATSKGVYIVQEYDGHNGFEVFKPATDKMDWESVLAAIE